MRALLLTAILWTMISPAIWAQPAPITTATVSPKMPVEVVDGDGNNLPVNVSQLPLDFFNDYAWRMFLSLNWPAKEDVRGVADETKQVGDPGKRVWETWKTSFEIVPKSAAPEDAPKPWESFDGKTPCSELDVPTIGSGKRRILAVWKPYGDFHQAGFGEFDETNPLVCQNKTHVRYEVRVNQEEYEFILAKKLYLKSIIRDLPQPVRFTNNSVEVKAAWRELGDDVPQAEADTYYAVKFLVHDPKTGDCIEKRMGLVGFHIVHKTPLRPQWVWSSFEHIKNVPLTAPPAATEKFSFNDATKPQTTDVGPPVLSLAAPPMPPLTPTQVVRELPLHPAASGHIGTAAMNKRYQTALAGKVWANYMLVATQWPTKTTNQAVNPPDNIDGDPFPPAFGSTTNVSNTVLESYRQSNSCMGCHDSARQTNMDFVFFLDFHAFNDTSFSGLKPRSLDLLREAIRKGKQTQP
jgi:hypothetical protein